MSQVAVTIDGQTYEVIISPARVAGTEYIAELDGRQIPVHLAEGGNYNSLDWITVDNRSYELSFSGDLHWLNTNHGRFALDVRDLDAVVARPVSADGRMKAPIPGLITRVRVEPGQQVTVGQPLLVLEAMKMENELLAPRDGKVGRLNVEPGQTVTLGELLIEIL
jgi:acetyl/propionyl-CoA carboxylase alpha subunit